MVIHVTYNINLFAYQYHTTGTPYSHWPELMSPKPWRPALVTPEWMIDHMVPSQRIRRGRVHGHPAQALPSARSASSIPSPEATLARASAGHTPRGPAIDASAEQKLVETCARLRWVGVREAMEYLLADALTEPQLAERAGRLGAAICGAFDDRNKADLFRAELFERASAVCRSLLQSCGVSDIPYVKHIGR
jgi:hypothetical protein